MSSFTLAGLLGSDSVFHKHRWAGEGQREAPGGMWVSAGRQVLKTRTGLHGRGLQQAGVSVTPKLGSLRTDLCLQEKGAQWSQMGCWV